MAANIYIYLLILALKNLRSGWGKISVLTIYAQAFHETGGFTSEIYKENNNLFGMKLPAVRKTKATGENRGHATYSSLSDSIIDYFLRQENFNIDRSEDQPYMIDTINSGYAEDTEYYEKWQNTIEQKKNLEQFIIQLELSYLHSLRIFL